MQSESYVLEDKAVRREGTLGNEPHAGLPDETSPLGQRRLQPPGALEVRHAFIEVVQQLAVKRSHRRHRIANQYNELCLGEKGKYPVDRHVRIDDRRRRISKKLMPFGIPIQRSISVVGRDLTRTGINLTEIVRLLDLPQEQTRMADQVFIKRGLACFRMPGRKKLVPSIHQPFQILFCHHLCIEPLRTLE